MDNNVIIYTLIFLTSLHVGKADPDDTLILELKEKGRLEVRYKGNWGSICYSPSFDGKAAKVACQQMGFRSGTFYGTKKLENDSKIVLQNVICSGQEDGFSQCKLTAADTSSTCGLAVVVDCESDPALDGLFDAKLIGNSKQANKGILQATKRDISKGTITGAVCHDSGTAPTVARIVCKQMGYPGVEMQTAASASSDSSFYTATCKGTELTLAACTLTHGTNCSSNSVIDVECKLDMATQATFDVRLSQSSLAMTDTNHGTVEVKIYDKWGVICDTGWDINEANVVCTQLGFKGAVPTTGFLTKAKFGQGTGIIFWNNVQCSGDEESIAECKHDEVLGTSACNSVNASGVICSNETLPTFDICSNETITIPAGVSFLRSPGYPKPFNYPTGTTCSWTSTNLTAATNLILYIHQKMFKRNHEETLTFYNDSSEIRLHGDNSSAGPFSFTGTDNFTIQFESDDSAGEGMLNIQIKATEPVEFACTIVKVPSTTQATTATNTSTNGTANVIHGGEPTDKTGMIAGIVIGLILCSFIIGVPIWWFTKKKKTATEKIISKRSNSVGSFDQTGDGSKQGVDNPNGEDEMKKNDIYVSADEKGKVNIQGGTVGVTDIYTVATPKSKRSKEPETGEMSRNGIDRPASGSHVKVCFANQAFKPDEERPPQHNGSPRALKEPLGGDVKSQFDAQDIDNGNVEDDINSPAMYSLVNESASSNPGRSAAYEEVDFGGASRMQTQPNEETPKKDEKKKKSKKKKDKSEDTNKKKKKRGFGTTDDHPDGQRIGGSCAVPKSDDSITGIYAEADQKAGVGRSEPFKGFQPDNSEDTYARLDHNARRKPAPSGDGAIYATANYSANY